MPFFLPRYIDPDYLADLEKAKVELSNRVIRRNWPGVVRIYMKYDRRDVQGMKITHSGYTALHIAACESQEKLSKNLVELMVNSAIDDVLHLADDRGNTALHLAVTMGNLRMCQSIASRHPQTIGDRNNDNETPLFLAALHGKKQVFSTLCYYCCLEYGDSSKILTYGRRNTDGRTVLHCAIDGEYFDLALQIINYFPEFIHSVDEQGHTALHLVASNPSAFKSSSSIRFTLLQKFIYPYIPAEKPSWIIGPPMDTETVEESSYMDDISTTDDEEIPTRMIKNRRHKYVRWFNKLCYTARSFNKRLFTKAVVLLNCGLWRKVLFTKQLLEMKAKHFYFVEIVKTLVRHTSYYDYKNTGSEPISDLDAIFDFNKISDQNSGVISDIKIEISDQSHSGCSQDNQKKKENQDSSKSSQNKKRKIDTPIIIATKNGIGEIVRDILRVFPMAIYDVNSEGKNLMLLAVENRQVHIFKLLKDGNHITNNLFHYMDDKANSVLHLAAMVNTDRPWLDPTVVLQMQWEIKWYEFIKDSVPKYLLNYQNDQDKTPEDTFREQHKELVKSDTEWLNKASESCTLVATLMATVAFATSASVPGGVNGRNGEPILKQQRMFEVFAVTSLIALCFSLTALVMFLSILTSRHQVMDFGKDLPRKFLMGLTALFISIASMLVSFCGGHFFVLKNVLTDAWIAEYLLVFLPVTIFTIAQFPLYIKLFCSTIKKVPGQDFRVTP